MSGKPARSTGPRAAKARVLVLYDGAFSDVVTRHQPGHALAPIAAALGDAAPVTQALVDAGFAASSAPLTRDPSSLLRAVAKRKPDVVMSLCDTLGGVGEHALLVPAMLAAMNVRFAGAATAGLALSKRKHDVKAVLSREALPTPRYQVIHGGADVDAFVLRIAPPVIVKLSGEHASIGLEQASVCADGDEVKARARSLFARFAQPLLIEEFVDGRELSVSFRGDPPVALPAMEHPFDHLPPGFLRLRTFDTKWTDRPGFSGERPGLLAAAPIPVRAPTVDVGWDLRGLVEACTRAFVVVGCRDWGRVDVRIDKGGVPLIIDVTPNTYLGPTSPCAKAANAAGVSFTDFVAAIVHGALSRPVSEISSA